jgi:hypothetical protein
MKLRLPVASVTLCLATACASARVPQPPVLDWAAPRVQVHIDNIAADKVPVFEDARRRWLGHLHEAGRYLPDGRPLFFSNRRGSVQTYLTFYPFATWTELDLRAAATGRTEATVGKAAVDDYNSGDAALVPPHHSEIWLREPDMDYVPAGAARLGPAGASQIWLEAREMPAGAAAADADKLWDEVKARLAEVRYPLTCRAYWSLFGRGQLVLLWLAPDDAALRDAPGLETALSAPGGSADLAKRLEAALPVRLKLTLDRRDDLSNLAR